MAPFTLSSYDEVVGWAETIREVVQEGRMPPWFADPKFGHFTNDARLSDEEKKTDFRTWVENGCPKGDDKDLPEPRKFVEGWQIGEPDQVVYMRDEPFKVPAEGVVDYQFFTVDPGWTTDKWIQATEARPGNRGVVHHIIVFVQPKDGGDAAWPQRRHRRLCSWHDAERQPAGHGHSRAGRREAGVPDALHAQRQSRRKTAAWSASSSADPKTVKKDSPRRRGGRCRLYDSAGRRELRSSRPSTCSSRTRCC